MKYLSNEIEILRRNLVNVGIERGTEHPDVLKLSQRLDKLIVRYYIENGLATAANPTSAPLSWG